MILFWPFQVLTMVAKAMPEMLAAFAWVLMMDIGVAWAVMAIARLWRTVRP